jgi:hypothetical protein
MEGAGSGLAWPKINLASPESPAPFCRILASPKSSRLSLVGGNEIHAGKVRPVPTRIPSEQREPRASGVRANEEVGQDAGARPTLRAATLKCLARQKESRARHLHKFETDIRKNFV